MPAYRSPAARGGVGAAFLKISRVAADIAKANAAVLIATAGDVVVDCRLVFGSVAPTPAPRAQSRKPPDRSRLLPRTGRPGRAGSLRGSDADRRRAFERVVPAPDGRRDDA